MAIIQQTSNPVDYVPDFNWIGQVGQTLNGMVSKYPELKAIDQSIQNNKEHNTEAHQSIGLLYDAVRSDPEAMAEYAKIKGIDPASSGFEALVKDQVQKDMVSLKPKKGESNQDYTKRAVNQMQFLSGMDSFNDGVLAQAAVNLDNVGQAGADFAQGIREDVGERRYGDKLGTTLEELL